MKDRCDWRDQRLDRLERQLSRFELRAEERIFRLYMTIFWILEAILIAVVIGSAIAARA